MQYIWKEEKNEQLKHERGISFERICVAIESGRILDIRQNLNSPEYAHQKLIILEIDGYAWVVPFYDDATTKTRVLITVFPSRKFQQQYLGHQS